MNTTDVDGNDEWWYDAFDERWRLLARYSGSETAPREDFVPHQAGANGSGGSSYIDLVICRNKDTDVSGQFDERTYVCQNWRADVSALVLLVGSSDTEMREWIKYSAYGTPTGLPVGDTNSDGDCDINDRNQVQTWITGLTYDVRGDLNLDGVVDTPDKTNIRMNHEGVTLGRGVLSASGVGNRKGYAGYEQLSGLVGGKWLARNRVLATDLGRWLSRDPDEEASRMNLYQCDDSAPIAMLDAFGTMAACVAQAGPIPDEPGRRDPPTGPGPAAMSAGDCCKKAKLDLKLDYGSHGGVICCDGKMIACNWWWPHDDQIKARAKEKKLPHPPSAEVEGMIADCMTKHEQAHFGVTPPCDKKQKGIDRPDPNFKGTDAEKEEQKKAEEREKNQEELDCINKKKCKDPNDTNCNGWLKSRKEHLRDNVRLYGGNPKG